MFRRRPGQHFNPNAGGGALNVVWPSPPGVGFPTAFNFESVSAQIDLASCQGVAFNPELTRFWATCKVPGAGVNVNKIFEYDAAYNEVAESPSYGAAHGLPADTSQVNGIVLWEGKLYVGYNNYDILPRTGGIIVVDPDDLTTVEAVHPTTNGHVEGCTIRNTRRGPEAFVFTNTGRTIERYDLATWTKQGEHDFGYWAVGDIDATYQGGDWFGDMMLLALHGNQLRPPTIDGALWDDVACTFIPFARYDRPTINSAQGFNLTADRTHSYHAERNIATTPDQYRIVRASVASVATLPHSTPNPASSQLQDLQHWYQRLTWNANTHLWELVDTQGNGPVGTGYDESRVWPRIESDGVRKIRFNGEDGQGIPLGDLFGAGWAEATIWFRGVRVHRNDSNDMLLSFDATGSNLGDGAIEVNRTTARTVSFRYTTAAAASVTLTSPLGNLFTLGTDWNLCVQLRTDGARIYVNGAEVAANAVPGRIGGAGQACFLGSNLLGQLGAEFDCWDVRMYNAVKDPAVLATYDMWSD